MIGNLAEFIAEGRTGISMELCPCIAARSIKLFKRLCRALRTLYGILH